MAVINRKNNKGWYIPPKLKTIHIQTIASQFRLRHKEIEEIAKTLNIKPIKYSSEGYNIYSERDGQLIIDCLNGN